jgi:hypothetical protein
MKHSDHSHAGGLGGADQMGRQVLPSERRKHAVLDVAGQFIRPLRYCRYRDFTHRGGFARGAAQQLDCFCLFHPPILVR